MTHSSSSTAFSPRQPGRLSRTIIRLLMKRATVVRAGHVGEGFRDITLESPEFRNVTWAPGQKVQIALGSAFVTRTYTPIEWDAAKWQTRIFGFAHGVGPGSDWVRSVQPGDECGVFGPRASLGMESISGPVMLFGDETSFGLAHATLRQGRTRPVQSLFEVNAIEVARAVLETLGLNAAELFTRRPGDDHLREVERRLATFATGGGVLVLTGKAASIQRLRQALKVLDVPAARIMTKAYWAPGRVGLD